MGWSCSKAANDALKPLDDLCRETTGSSNTWKTADGREFFFETSRREYPDGAITGEVIEMGPPTHCGDARCTECFGARSGRKVGTFKIAGDGSLERAPAVMKLAMGRTTKKPGPAKGKAVAVFVATPVWQTKVGA